MLNEREFFIESLRDHLYYLRSIRQFCITIELSFYKNNESDIPNYEFGSQFTSPALKSAENILNQYKNYITRLFFIFILFLYLFSFQYDL